MPAVTLRNSTLQISQNCGRLPGRIQVHVAVGDHARGMGPFRRRPAFRLPAIGRHPEAKGPGGHHQDIDHAHHHQGAGHALAAIGGEVVHQQHRQGRPDHGAATVAHDGETGGHAAPVRKPLDQGRNRCDVAQALAHTTEDAAAQVHQPQLVDHHANAADHQAATPAQRRDHARLAGTGVLQPAAPEGR